jgi:hypothetical protein
MSSPTTNDILDNITTSCTAVHPGVLPIPVAPAGVLPRYDAACVAVAMAKTVDEVQEIASNAEALRAYARQAKNRQLELDAAEIRIRADRRVGQLMSGQGHIVGKAKGAQGIGTSAGYKETRTPEGPPTLAEAGIDKNQAHRARTLAAMPDEAFEERLGDKRHRKDRRVVLGPEAEAKAEATTSDIAPGERTPEALAAENAALRKRVTALLRENRTLRERIRMWEARGDSAVEEDTVHA